MAITIKLFTQIINELIGWVQTHANELDDFNDGSDTKTLLEALAFELDFSNLQIEQGQNAEAIDSASGVDLDLKVSDYGILRKVAVSATGILQFTLTTPAPLAGFVIPGGTVVSTPAVFNPYDAIEYTTNVDLVIPSGNTTGTVAATALVAGSAGNQPPGAIIVLVSSISGVLGVTNSASFTNGTDAETDAALRIRGKAVFTSVTNDLATSFQAVTLSTPGILSVSVAGFGDPLMTRDLGQGGKVDVYFQGPVDSEPAVESFIFNNLISGGDYKFSPFVYAPPTFNVLRNIPVLSITQVKNMTTSAIINPANYALINDATFFQNTDRAQDVLHWISTAGISNGDTIQVTFQFDNRVEQARQSAETKRGVTLDLIVKKGIAVPVNVTLSVNANKGVDQVALRTSLIALISNFLNSRTLDQDILQAAIVLMVAKFNGVQNVVLPLTVLSTGGAGVSDIDVDKAHYVVAGTINVTVLPPLAIQV